MSKAWMPVAFSMYSRIWFVHGSAPKTPRFTFRSRLKSMPIFWATSMRWMK
ncbi:MAG: hypothetical protein BWX86_02993 [Verrucomicrobia bacterium ADurb.Bin122]|nr:MAG: hypothetical protein BWX86_02993 [Verrucomicrobia bacterium ADurb.Bin122]